MKTICYFETCFGPIGIAAQDGAITDVVFGQETAIADITAKETPLLREAAGQLKSYFEGKRKIFDLPLAPKAQSSKKKSGVRFLRFPMAKPEATGKSHLKSAGLLPAALLEWPTTATTFRS